MSRHGIKKPESVILNEVKNLSSITKHLNNKILRFAQDDKRGLLGILSVMHMKRPARN